MKVIDDENDIFANNLMHTELNKRSGYQNLVQSIASSIENRKEENYQRAGNYIPNWVGNYIPNWVGNNIPNWVGNNIPIWVGNNIPIWVGKTKYR